MPITHRKKRAIHLFGLTVVLGMIFTSAAWAETVPAAPDDKVNALQDYILGVGDKIHITVFDEPNLSGDFDISSTGLISLPLIGETKATGLTLPRLKTEIMAKLSDGFMKNPKVNIEVLNYRPFFILGEVAKPGSYSFVNGMSVVNAVALAGGYTYRAEKDGITLKHEGSDKTDKVKEEQSVMPGDVINVPERFF
jgi:polysaccharide biosynthesis/export protein VpsN